MATLAPAPESLVDCPRGERLLYSRAAALALVVIFVGFAPTYFLKSAFGGSELSTIKHVHGLVMTSWFVLFLVQARLVATGNTPVHRKLGLAGVALAVLVVVLGMMTGIASARAGATPLPSIPPLAFFIMPVGEIVVFATLVAAAIVLRRRSAWHKRLILCASLSILSPAFARWPLISDAGPLAFFAATDLLIVGCMVYDARANRRVHPAFTVSAAFIVVAQLGRLALAGTAAWTDFARWVIS